MKTLACAFTGHRPVRYSFGYDEEHEKCKQLKAVLETQIAALIGVGVTTFYSGMALGVDIWASGIVLKMKESKPNVRLIAVLPCETQANKWSEEQRERYFNMLSNCDEVITLNTHYTPSCMHERNRYLIDYADYLLAVYDHSNRGGTAYTIQYAQEKNRNMISVHPDTLEVLSAPELEALRRRSEWKVLRNEESGI